MKLDRIPPLEELLEKLEPRRIERLKDVIRHRMKGLTVVLERLYDPGNRSACYRSADAYGLRDVHVVKPRMARKSHARQVSRGAEKWLRVHEWEDAQSCVDRLHEQGFRVFASHLEAATPLHALPFDEPVALVFGNEHEGVTAEMVSACDGRFILPMRGFAESFNISVAAGIALSQAREARERATGQLSDLSAAERDELFEEFVIKSSSWLKRAGVYPYRV